MLLQWGKACVCGLRFFFLSYAIFSDEESAKPTVFNRSACTDAAFPPYCSFSKNLLNKTAYLYFVLLSDLPSQLSDCKILLDKYFPYWHPPSSLGDLPCSSPSAPLRAVRWVCLSRGELISPHCSNHSAVTSVDVAELSPSGYLKVACVFILPAKSYSFLR